MKNTILLFLCYVSLNLSLEIQEITYKVKHPIKVIHPIYSRIIYVNTGQTFKT